MLQVIQYQKTGEILVEELPAPLCPAGGILVRTAFSLISAGTERASVSNAQASLIERARRQPDQAKLVLDTFKKEGIIKTAQKVRSKLDSYKVLGYSAAGRVIESGCDEFAVGDLVACGGAGFANHAEYIAIPKNLAVKIPEGVCLEEAAYTTVGAIAMQGVRQAAINLGETVAVIGLGLIGQITVQLLKAAGCRVVGLDIDESLFESARKFGCDATFASSADSIKSILAFSRGLGCDSVLLTASTASNEPLELALKIARKKGNIVIVGAVGMNLPRSPFYEKELDIKISCSYGPGRYDAAYEEQGIDYPPAYVRWTENRNMQSFLDLIAQKKIDVTAMTTHKFEIARAAEAYKMITGKKDSYLGILLSFPDVGKEIRHEINVSQFSPKSKIGLGFVGAGSFAQNYLIPPLKGTKIDLIGVSTASPVNALNAAKKFGFNISTTDSSELISNPDVNLIFCATRHDSHAKYVLESLKAGKPVFVEKPLAVSPEELAEIDAAIEKYKGAVMVGFNRRFSKAFRMMKDYLEPRSDAMLINYRVNAGSLPRTHWVFSPENHGRIIGECCHFIDCMVYLTGAMPVKVFAEKISSTNTEIVNEDNAIITIKFADGSVGTLLYTSLGDTSVGKEYCEVFCEGKSLLMNNFESLILASAGKQKKYSLDGKKGHSEEVLETITAVKEGKPMPIPYEQIRAETLATFAGVESLAVGTPVEILP